MKEVLVDTVKLIIDYANAPKKEKKKVDTGKFKKIYKGIEISDKPLNTAGLNLTLEGMPIKKSKQNNSVKITTFSLDKKWVFLKIEFFLIYFQMHSISL